MRKRLRKKLEKQGRLPNQKTPKPNGPSYLKEDSRIPRMYKTLQSLDSNHSLLALATIQDGYLSFTPEFYNQHPDIIKDLPPKFRKLARSTIRYGLELSDVLKERGQPGLSGF